LSGKARIDVLQQLADRANDFTQALLEKGNDFQQAAAKFQAPVKETGEFTATASDSLLQADPQLAQVPFQLSAQEPNSDAIQTPDGFFILHLAGITPARPLTLDESKPKIVESLKQERLQQMLTSKAAEMKRQIEQKIKSGLPAAEAIQQAGLKPELIPPFAFRENTPPNPQPKKPANEPPDLPAIKEAVSELNPGDVTSFVPTADGGLIAVLQNRESIDEAQFTQRRGLLESRVRENMQRIVFYEWLRDRRRDSGFQIATS
jgi:hypothetical protein